MLRLHDHSGQVNDVRAILASAGFQIRGKRATCPYCEGNRSLTVAITEDGRWFCHRCHKGGNVHTLARQQGVTFPLPRIRRANIPKAAFRRWLSEKMTTLADEERRAYRMKHWATAALRLYPDSEPALDFIAWFYVRRHIWEQFWESASDRCGRFWLYRHWRRYAK